MTTSCPNCGAPITFRWSSAVQTTCDYCKAILVRHDVDLERVGEIADVPATPSPVQLGTEGTYEKQSFVVVGRIVYEYDRGTWNEWHVVFADGRSGWLADAQAVYTMSFLKDAGGQLPPAAGVTRGQRLRIDGVDYEAMTLTRARYRAVEGELPFEYWDKAEVPFLDLRSHEGHFATIDYSEADPLLFVGAFVEYDDLALRNVREFEGWPVPGPGTRG